VVLALPTAEPSPLRILHAIANLEIGGAQEVVRSLMPALRAQGAEPAVVALRDGSLRGDLERAGIPVYIIPGRSRSLVRDPRAAAELWRIRRALLALVKSLRTQVIQTHLLRSLDFLMLTLSGRSLGPRIIWTFHNARLDLRSDQLPIGAPLLGAKRRAYRSLYRLASRRAAALVAVSSEVAASVRRDLRPAPGRLVIIPNGVEPQRYARPVDRRGVRSRIGVPRDAMLVICVAKLYEQKGHKILLDALRSPSLQQPDLHLAIVGDGPLASPIRALVASSGMADRVHLLGERSDVPDLLGASDVFVLPSLWEGMPMALLEAMASGLPVIASRVSGTEEVLGVGEAGILVNPGDAAGLAGALSRLSAEASLRDALGAAGRRRVAAQYSVDAQARAHRDLYLRCLRPPSRKAA
jgi:glycosyltransferase involved in cell wall biosynthesis